MEVTVAGHHTSVLFTIQRTQMSSRACGYERVIVNGLVLSKYCLARSVKIDVRDDLRKRGGRCGVVGGLVEAGFSGKREGVLLREIRFHVVGVHELDACRSGRELRKRGAEFFRDERARVTRPVDSATVELSAIKKSALR